MSKCADAQGRAKLDDMATPRYKPVDEEHG